MAVTSPAIPSPTPTMPTPCNRHLVCNFATVAIMSGSSSCDADDESFSRLPNRQLDELDEGLPKFWREHDPDAESDLEEIGVHNFLEQHTINGSVLPGITATNRPEWSRHFAAVEAQIKVSASRVNALDDTSKIFAIQRKRLDAIKTQYGSIARSLDRYKGTCTDKVLADTIAGIYTFVKRHPSILPALMKKLSSPDAEYVDDVEELRHEIDTLASNVSQLKMVQAEHISHFKDTRQLALESQSTVKGLVEEMRTLTSSYEAEYISQVEAQKELESLRSEVETLRKDKSDAEKRLVDREYHLTSRVDGLQISLDKCQKDMQNAVSELASNETCLRTALNERDACKEEHASASRRYELSEIQLNSARADLADANGELQMIKTERDDLEGRVTRNNSLILQYGRDHTAAEKTIAGLRKEVADVQASCNRAKGFNTHFKQSIEEIKKQNGIISKEKAEVDAQVFDVLRKYNAKDRELLSKEEELRRMTDKVKSLEAQSTSATSEADLAMGQLMTEKEELRSESSRQGARIKELEVALATSKEGLVKAEATIQDITAVLDLERTGRTPLQLAQSQCGLVGDLQKWKSDVEESRSHFYQHIVDTMFAGTVLHQRSTLYKLESDFANASQLGQYLQHGQFCLDVENFQIVHGIPPTSEVSRTAWEQALILLGQIHSDNYEVSVGDVEAIGIGLRSSDYSSTRTALILLYRFVRLRRDRLEPSDCYWSYPTSLVVLRAMEILASHTTDGAALWLMSELFTTIQRRLPLNKLLVKLLTESVRCRLENTTPSMRAVVESITAQTFLPAGEYLVGLEDENLVLVNHGGDVAIVSPDRFTFQLDALGGWYVNFNEAPLVGSWQAPHWPHDIYLQDVLAFSAPILPKALHEIDGNGRFLEQWIDRVQ